MRIYLFAVMLACAATDIQAQPGKGNGNSDCRQPPCGGPNQVPLDAQWLVYAGLLAGGYLTVKKRNKPTS